MNGWHIITRDKDGNPTYGIPSDSKLAALIDRCDHLGCSARRAYGSHQCAAHA